jgi:hypothetical protein
MRNTVLAGVALALFAALVVGLGGLLGLDLDHVALLGAALGGVVGLVPDRTPTARVVGFLAGVAVGWAGFVLRAAVLPDSGGGRAVAAFVVVALCLAVSAATLTRLPLWSLLVGVAAVVGAYEETYTLAPSQLPSESPTAVTTVLLAAALGYLATALLGPRVVQAREHEAGHHVGQHERQPDAHAVGAAPAGRGHDDLTLLTDEAN